MNTTEVAVPQPWRDLMQEQKDRITALKQQNSKLVEALKGLLEATPQEECESGCDTDNCPWRQARAVLKELGE